MDEKNVNQQQLKLMYSNSPDLNVTGGTKNDQAKLDYSLVSKNTMDAVSIALMYGANKYKRFNYLAGFKYSRLLASLGRHLHQLQSGEDYDSESGLHHLAHIMANGQMLLDNLAQGTLADDRYKMEENKLNLKNNE